MIGPTAIRSTRPSWLDCSPPKPTTVTLRAATAPIPSNVRDVVRRRLVLLSPSTVELLQLAAVIGRDFDLEVLTLASGRPIDECLDDLDVALEQRLLIVEPDAPSTFRFAHALVREVMVDDLPPLRRARHHLRVADAIEALGPRTNDLAEILADHLLAAAPVGTRRRAAEALVAASDVADSTAGVRIGRGRARARAVELWQAGSDEDEGAELDALARLVMLRRAGARLRRGRGNARSGQEPGRAPRADSPTGAPHVDGMGGRGHRLPARAFR